jgi:FAD/FMN-containing dehydrogenase
MLGGGLGRLEGLHGLTSDALLSVRMITGNGTVVQASRTANEDLFWGIRGAGQNFGVIVEAVFETYPATNGGMQYSSDLTFSADKLEAVLNVTDSLLIPNLDPRLAIATAIAPDPTTLEVSDATRPRVSCLRQC